MAGRRWHPVNAAKNSLMTVQIDCTLTGKRYVVPSQSDENLDYFDETPADIIRGSTTLHDLIQRVKKDLPALYLTDETGGGILTCGQQKFPKSEWDTTMLWELICEEKAGSIPWVKLDDGREAVIVTIGNEQKVMTPRPTTVHRILARGNRTPSLDFVPEEDEEDEDEEE